MVKITTRKQVLHLRENTITTINRPSSKIYVFDNHIKYKEFSQVLHPYTKDEDRMVYEDLVNQVNETSKYISFPHSLVASKRLVYGIISNYEEGKTFHNINKSMDIYLLMNELENIQKEIKRLSDKGWVLEDLHASNILIDENYNIRIIDTDFYYIDLERPKEEIYKDNLALLFDLLLETILNPLLKSKILHDKKIFTYQIYAQNGTITPVEFIASLICTLYSNPPTHLSIEDLSKKLKLHK